MILKDKKKIQAWLDKHEINGYTIRDDFTVDVEGTVYLTGKCLTSIDVQFNVVEGSFYCQGNQLVSLEGCPFEVGYSFECANNKLTSLKYSPLKVGTNFNCECNKIETLKGMTQDIGISFYAGTNRLTSLEGSVQNSNGKLVQNLSYNEFKEFRTKMFADSLEKDFLPKEVSGIKRKI